MDLNSSDACGESCQDEMSERRHDFEFVDRRVTLTDGYESVAQRPGDRTLRLHSMMGFICLPKFH